MHRTTFVVFAVLFAVLVGLISHQFPPRGVLERSSEATDDPLIDLEIGDVFAWEFQARGDNLAGLVVNHFFSDREGEMDFKVENVTRSTQLAERILGMGHIATISLEGEIQSGDTLRVTYEILKSQKERFPQILQGVKRSYYPPHHEIQVFINGRALGEEEMEDERYWPLFHETYETSVDRALRIWWLPLLFLIALILSRGSGRWIAAWMIFTALVISGVSLRAYFDRYEFHWVYADPDGYGEYGVRIHQWLTGDEAERREAAAWMKAYPHLHIPLTPLLVGAMRFLGVGPLPALTWWAGVCSFGCVLLLHWFLRKKMLCHWRTCLLIACLMLYHVIFIRAFGRASTDPSGVLLAMSGLVVLYLRGKKKFTWWQEVLFGLFLLVNAMARPPGLAISFLYLAVAWVMDHVKDRSRLGWELVVLAGLLSPFAIWGLMPFIVAAGLAGLIWVVVRWKALGIRIPQSFTPTLLHGLPFVGLYAISYLAFGWHESVERNFEKADKFSMNSTWSYLRPSLLITCYPLLMAIPGWALIRKVKDGGAWLAAFWVISLLLLLTVFEAPYYNRILLPALPAVMILAGIALNDAVRKAPWIACGIVVLASFWGGWILTWMLSFPDWPPEPWAKWFFF